MCPSGWNLTKTGEALQSSKIVRALEIKVRNIVDNCKRKSHESNYDISLFFSFIILHKRVIKLKTTPSSSPLSPPPTTTTRGAQRPLFRWIKAAHITQSSHQSLGSSLWERLDPSLDQRVCVGVCVCAAEISLGRLGDVPPAASVPTRQPTASNHMSAIWEPELLSSELLTCVSLWHVNA